MSPIKTIRVEVDRMDKPQSLQPLVLLPGKIRATDTSPSADQIKIVDIVSMLGAELSNFGIVDAEISN